MLDACARLRTSVTVLVSALALALTASVAAAESSLSADDTAKLLGGLAPAAGTPAADLVKERSWQGHAAFFDKSWAEIEKRQLTHIRTWAGTELPQTQTTLDYLFSGPDFLYAQAFFPGVTTYIMAGLEPVGSAPNLLALNAQRRGSLYAELRDSLRSVLSFSFFRTKDMRRNFGESQLKGTVPVILTFLARTGMKVDDLSYVDVTADGDLKPAEAGKSGGLKVQFTDASGKSKTLYYFSTDLSNSGVAKSGFLKFCEKQGKAMGLVKSASFLMHSDEFSKVREFLLANTDLMVEDDSGIPVAHFDDKAWTLKPYGSYLGPISLFTGKYQNKLKDLYRREQKRTLPFGIGYRYRPSESNLLVASRKP